jgi:hypothetical protein
MKGHITQSSLFLDSVSARDASEEVLSALTAVRAAKRWTCKAESKAGMEANGQLHDAEAALERALKSMGAKARTK